MRAFFGTLAYNAGYNHTLRLFKKMTVAQLVHETKEIDGDGFFTWVFHASKTDAKLKEYKDSIWTNDIELDYNYEDLVPLEIAKAYISLRNPK